MKRWSTTLIIVFILFLSHSSVFAKSLVDTEAQEPSSNVGLDSRVVSGLDPDWSASPSPFTNQSDSFILKIDNGRHGQIAFPAVLDSQNPIVIQIQNKKVQQILASNNRYQAELIGKYLVYRGEKNSILYRFDADKQSLREFVYLKDASALAKNGDVIQWRFEGADLTLRGDGSAALTHTINIKNEVRKVSNNHMAERISGFLAKQRGTPVKPDSQTRILFTIPKPEYIDGHGKTLTQGIQYKVTDAKLTLHLDTNTKLSYPLWVDPSFEFSAGGAVDIIFRKKNPPNILSSSNFPFGESIASAGDFNGDGVEDVIIGDSRGRNAESESTGSAFIFFGHQPIEQPEILNTLDNADITLQGTNDNDQFGYSVASAGDFNGDGLDDVLVGARWDDNNGYSSGRAFIFYGRNTNGPMFLQADTDADIIINSKHPQGWLGSSVASAGDFNNDGLDDVMVGEPRYYDNSSHDSGSVSIYFGRLSTNQLIFNPDTDANVIIEGDDLGETLAPIGDFNGDGFEDVVFGLDDQALIIFGRQASNQLVLDAPFEANIFIRGQFFNDGFGASVSSAGDFNGDGLDDVIIGAPGTDHFGTSSGSAYIFFGQSPTENLILRAEIHADIFLHGQNVQDRFGTSLASIGDLNQDGFDDIIVGAPGADSAGLASIFEGSVNFIYGRESSSQITLLAPNDTQFTYMGWDNSDLGKSFGVGDFNGMGTIDVLASTVGSGVFLFFQEDSTAPELTLNGNALTLWEVGTPYVDPGATAIDIVDGDLTQNIVVGGLPINTDDLGTHVITYDATDSSGNTAHAERTVNVVDSPPIITILGFSIATVEIGFPYIDAGATAADLIDGNLTANIVVEGLPVDTNTLGQYIVTYDVTDSFSNTTHAERIVNVVQIAPPIITILGNNPETVEGGSIYIDAGATAVDIVDGDLTSNIVIGGLPLDTSTLGAKTVTYDVVSSRNSSAHADRTVHVVDTTPPVLTTPSDLGPIEAVNRYTSVNIGTATATDNISVASITNDAPIAFPLGTTVITWTATDSSGNTATAIQNVTIQDTTPPWNIPHTDKLVDATGVLTTVNIGNTNAWDPVELLSVVNDAPEQFPLGNTVVTWTATDTSGNVTIAKQNVKVQHHHQSIAQIDGLSANDFFGYSVATAGDFNGDGITDIIVGAYGDDNYNSVNALGSVFIFFGKNDSTPFNLKNSADADVILDSQDQLNEFGFSVASAGDFNGDGFDDVIVGSPRNRKAFIFFGRNPTNQLLLIADMDADIILDGQNATGRFGHSVSSAGDFNGDGLNDVIIGAPGTDNIGTSPGSSYIFFGRNPTSQQILRADLDANITLNSEGKGDQFGNSVASAGDFNGDGLSDVIVGARYNDNNGERDSGSAFIFFGQNPANQLSLDADADADIILDGQNQGDRFGFSVSSAGDFNGDELGDVIVGAPFDDNLKENSTLGTSGSAFIFFGQNTVNQTILRADTDANIKINSQNSGEQFGYSVSSAGDFDGDGLDDVIVGAIFDSNNGIYSSGSASVFVGRNLAEQQLFNADKDSYIIVNGQGVSDRFGISVAPIGDFNNDGFDDVIVGAYIDDNNGQINSGSAFIYPGKGSSFPAITILGDNPAFFEIGTPYVDAGSIALDTEDGDITTDIIVSGLPLDTNNAGTFIIAYDVTNSSGNSTYAIRTVTVPDKIPPAVSPPADVTVEATGATTSVAIGTATATDNVAVVSITNNAPNEFSLGITVVTWRATDSSGNTSTATQNVTVQDTTAPAINLLGNDPVDVNKGESYTEAGATATDIVDNNLNSSIVTGGLPVDTTIIGPHIVTYDVTDSSGNTAHAERTVNVIDTTPPSANDVVFSFSSGVSINLNNNSSTIPLHSDTAEAIATADVDNNDIDDVIVSFPAGTGPDESGGTYISRNQAPLVLLDNRTAEQIAVGDFDGNGQVDLLLDFGANGLWARMNDTSATLLIDLPTVALAAGDIDNNGQDDIVLSLEGTGTFSLLNFGPIIFYDGDAADTLAIADIDNNGEGDVIASFPNGSGPGGTGGTYFARNQGTLNFFTGTPAEQISEGDFDGNGQNDLLLDLGNDGLWIWVNDSSATLITSLSPTAMATGDIDNSGQDDIALSFDGMGTVLIKNLTTIDNLDPGVALNLAIGNIDGN